jgi:hypothetical protein
VVGGPRRGGRVVNESPLARLRSLCLGLPEAREVEAWDAPTFRVKTMFATYSAPDTYGARPAAWVKAAPSSQELLVAADPGRYFVPPYVGPRGWVGVYLDGPDVDWDELRALLADAWRMSAPKRLAALHPEL